MISLAVVNIVGIGIDLAEIDRVERLLGKYPEKFRERCFTDHENAYADRFANPSSRLAARFAGKEAVMKSLGRGWRQLRWKDIEITGGGKPTVNLFGTAARRAAQLGVSEVHVSITHTDVTAMVLAISVAD